MNVNDEIQGELGRYRLQEEAGAGGMGQVFLAVDVASGERVAVKTVKADPDPVIARRFGREVTLLRSVQHPHVLRYRDQGLSQGQPFIVTDFIDGVPMGTAIAERAPRHLKPLAFRWGRELAGALDAVHRLGIVHRDLKPSNVIVRENTSLVLIDFGLARSDTVTRLTASNEVLGTLHYLAPEVYAGPGASPATDVYGWALIVYEILMRHRPFPHMEAAAALEERCIRAPELEVEGPLARLVEECLQPHPQLRPADGAALLERLAVEVEPYAAKILAALSSPSQQAIARAPVATAPLAPLPSLGIAPMAPLAGLSSPGLAISAFAPPAPAPAAAPVPAPEPEGNAAATQRLNTLNPVTVTEVGAWDIVRQIGKGGNSTVYECKHKKTGEQAAVKVAGRGDLRSDADRRRFEREAKLLSSLKSSRVVQVMDHGVDRGQHYMVMPLLEGEDLAARIARSAPLSVTDALALLIPVAEGVAALHEHGIVHRDLKPSNVMLAKGGPRIVDFGLARAAADDSLSQVGGFVGTLQYAPPEVRAGKTAGPSADVFALGVIAFELLTRTREVAAEGAAQKLADALARDPALSAPAARPVREQLAELVERATRPEASARLPDGHSFLRAALQIQTDLEKFTAAAAPAPVAEPAPAAARPVAATHPVARTKTKPGVGTRPDHRGAPPVAPPVVQPLVELPRWIKPVAIAVTVVLLLIAYALR